MRRRVLVTGSSGMLGVDLCEELAWHHEVIGSDIVRRAACGVPRQKLGAALSLPKGAQHFYKCNITIKKDAWELLKKTRPDVVIHTAAYTDVDGCELDPRKAYLVNSLGTENIALGCRPIEAALIYISTDFVFGGMKRTPYKETDRVGPLSVYGDSKLEGEKAVAGILKKHFILRTGWLYGKYGRNFVDTILDKARREKVLRVVDDQVGSPTYTKDLSKAIRALIDKVSSKPEAQSSKHCGIYHVTNSGGVSWCDYAKTILRLYGSRTKVAAISSEDLGRPAARPAMSALDNTKFSAFTGYKMREWKEALKEYLNKR